MTKLRVAALALGVLAGSLLGVAGTAPAGADPTGPPASCSVYPVISKNVVVDSTTPKRPVILHATCKLRAPVTLPVGAVCMTGSESCSLGSITWHGNQHGAVGDGAKAYLRLDQLGSGRVFIASQTVQRAGGSGGQLKTRKVSFHLRGRTKVSAQKYAYGHDSTRPMTFIASTGDAIYGTSSEFFAFAKGYSSTRLPLQMQRRVGGRWQAVRGAEIDYSGGGDGAYTAFAPASIPHGHFRIVALETVFSAWSSSRVQSW